MFTRTGTDIGYRHEGEDGGIAGEKSKEWIKDKSLDRTEEISVSSNLEMAPAVKMDAGGGSRSSEEGRECVESSRM